MPEIRISGVNFIGESSVSKALNLCQIVKMLSHVSYADCQAQVGPQTRHAQQKRGPGQGTRCRARPRNKKQGPANTSGAPLRCSGWGLSSRAPPRSPSGPSLFRGGAVRGEKSLQVLFTSRLERTRGLEPSSHLDSSLELSGCLRILPFSPETTKQKPNARHLNINTVDLFLLTIYLLHL